MKCLIIGYGTVGKNLYRDFSNLHPDIYDKYCTENNTKKEIKYDIAFICVDTPLTEQTLCDISEIERAIKENDADLFVIKSTVLPGTTDKLCEDTGKHVIFSPEYYGGTQHCNNFTFNFTILGGNKEDCLKVQQVLQHVYDGRHVFKIVEAKVAELAKYMENSFLACKVSFCINFWEAANKLGISYEDVRECFILDARVGASHTFVYDEKPYWDSHCLNKDVRAIGEYLNMSFVNTVIEYNRNMRNKYHK